MAYAHIEAICGYFRQEIVVWFSRPLSLVILSVQGVDTCMVTSSIRLQRWTIHISTWMEQKTLYKFPQLKNAHLHLKRVDAQWCCFQRRPVRAHWSSGRWVAGSNPIGGVSLLISPRCPLCNKVKMIIYCPCGICNTSSVLPHFKGWKFFSIWWMIVIIQMIQMFICQSSWTTEPWFVGSNRSSGLSLERMWAIIINNPTTH